jgi:hypothetical protein
MVPAPFPPALTVARWRKREALVLERHSPGRH